MAGLIVRGIGTEQDCGPALSPAAPLRQSRRKDQDEETKGDLRSSKIMAAKHWLKD
jgi:hypothetical protein